MREMDIVVWAPDALPVEQSVFAVAAAVAPGIRYHHVNAYLADTEEERREGMRNIPEGWAFLLNKLSPGHAITMDGMTRALDIIHISPACGMALCDMNPPKGERARSHAHVVGIERMEPGDPDRPIPPGVYAVLEMPEGWARMLGIKVGDAVDGKVRGEVK